MDTQEEIRRATALAVQQSVTTLRARGPLFGFTLATDDDVCTLFHVACSVDWVQKNELEHPGIGYMFVDWPDVVHGDLFSRISSRLAALSDQIHADSEAWAVARDQRFHALWLALKDCRDAGIFDRRTFLCVGSTDPSAHLQGLELRAVESLNEPDVVAEYARAME